MPKKPASPRESHAIYGIHAVGAVIQSQPTLIAEIQVIGGRQNPRVKALLEDASDHEIPVRKCSRTDFKKTTGGRVVDQGVLAVCHPFTGFDESVLKTLLVGEEEEKIFLVLDEVQDPHNLGACLRSAAAFGATAVIAPADRACGLTPVVRKVACGGAELTPFIQVKNVSRTLRELKALGVWLVGLATQGDTPLAEIDLRGNVALVLGNEGQGLRHLTRKHCDYLACVPMPGAMESLNVSNAAAVSLYEASRQRRGAVFNGG